MLFVSTKYSILFIFFCLFSLFSLLWFNFMLGEKGKRKRRTKERCSWKSRRSVAGKFSNFLISIHSSIQNITSHITYSHTFIYSILFQFSHSKMKIWAALSLRWVANSFYLHNFLKIYFVTFIAEKQTEGRPRWAGIFPHTSHSLEGRKTHTNITRCPSKCSSLIHPYNIHSLIHSLLLSFIGWRIITRCMLQFNPLSLTQVCLKARITKIVFSSQKKSFLSFFQKKFPVTFWIINKWIWT